MDSAAESGGALADAAAAMPRRPALLALTLLSHPLRSSTGAGPSTAGPCDLQRIDGRTVTPDFFDRSLRANVPILLTHLSEAWAASQPDTGWSNATAFADRYGAYDMPLRSSR